MVYNQMGQESNFHQNFVDFSKPKFYKVPKTRAKFIADKSIDTLKKYFKQNI